MKVFFSKRVSDSCSDNRQSKTCTELSRSIQNRKWPGLSVIAFVLVVTGAVADAQQPGKVLRIGFLDSSTASGGVVLLEAFRQEFGRRCAWLDNCESNSWSV